MTENNKDKELIESSIRAYLEEPVSSRRLESTVMSRIHNRDKERSGYVFSFAASAVAICLMGLFLYWYVLESPQYTLYRLSDTIPVRVNDEEAFQSTSYSMNTLNSIHSGDNQVMVRLQEKNIIIIDRNSELEIEQSTVTIQNGRIRYSNETGMPSSIVFETPHGTLTPVGTIFDIRVSDEATQVFVLHGSVEFKSSNQTHIISANESMGIDGSGTLLEHVPEMQDAWIPDFVTQNSWLDYLD